MAGYLAWFLPFIAAGLAKGALSLTGLATSMLTVPQSATTSAANEVASGHLNLGASNFDSISYNSVYENMGQNYAAQAASLKASSVDQMV